MITDMKQLFRIWLGVTEYLYRNEALLNEVINVAINDHSFRSDDLEFTFAARVSLCNLGLTGALIARIENTQAPDIVHENFRLTLLGMV